jgi:predicted transcriptional regulator
MPEQFKGEMGPIQEKSEDKEHKKFLDAVAKEEEIMKKITETLETMPDREEAEKVVLETLAPQMNEALAETKAALAEWLESMKKEG